MGAEVVGPGHEKGGSEGSCPAVLGVVLFVVADLLGQHLHADILAVVDLVDLGFFPGLVDKDPGVCDETGRRTADVIVDVVDLLDGLGLHKSAGDPFVYDQQHAVFEFDSDSRRSFLDGFAGVLHLEQPSVGGENGDSPIICHLSWLHCVFLLERGNARALYNGDDKILRVSIKGLSVWPEARLCGEVSEVRSS